MIHPHKPVGSDRWQVIRDERVPGLASRLEVMIADAGSTPEEAWALIEWMREHDDWRERLERGERP